MIALDGIAATTSVDEVLIVNPSLRIDLLGLKVINLKLTRYLPPLLALEAVDATKVEFVS